MTGQYEEYLTKVLPGLGYAPIAFTTATKTKNVKSVLDLAAEIFKQATTWIPTPKLNKAFEIIKEQQPGTSKIGRPRIYYATQVAVNPVTILMFVNKPELFDETYRRFIVGRLSSLLPVAEVPIRLLVRRRPGHASGEGRGGQDLDKGRGRGHSQKSKGQKRGQVHL
jgi:GTP-binding protein